MESTVILVASSVKQALHRLIEAFAFRPSGPTVYLTAGDDRPRCKAGLFHIPGPFRAMFFDPAAISGRSNNMSEFMAERFKQQGFILPEEKNAIQRD